MKPKVLVLAFLIGVTLVGWWGWNRTPAWVNLPPIAGATWVAFGDSLTLGTGADPGEDYPTQLGLQLGVPVLNQGVNGETTAGGLARVPEILRLRPRVVLLCLGGNDSLQRLSTDRTFANLGSIIDRFHEAGAFVVLIGIRSASVIDQHRGRFKTLAREKRVMLVPNFVQGILGDPSLMSDTIHPNAAGYRRMAERLAREIEPHLEALR